MSRKINWQRDGGSWVGIVKQKDGSIHQEYRIQNMGLFCLSYRVGEQKYSNFIHESDNVIELMHEAEVHAHTAKRTKAQKENGMERDCWIINKKLYSLNGEPLDKDWVQQPSGTINQLIIVIVITALCYFLWSHK